MPTAAKRKTSVSLDSRALEDARELGVNVSAVADAALKNAVTVARRERWLRENAQAFEAQAKWHEENGHPLAEILAGKAGATWQD